MSNFAKELGVYGYFTVYRTSGRNMMYAILLYSATHDFPQYYLPWIHLKKYPHDVGAQ